MNTCVRSHVLKYFQKSLWEWLPPSWIRTNPQLMPHIPQNKSKENARIPHIRGTQRAANMVIKPHMSRGGGGGVRGLLWLVHYTVTGSYRICRSQENSSTTTAKHYLESLRISEQIKYSRRVWTSIFARLWGPFQTPLHSCAEPNSIRFDFGVTLERRLIQTAYLHRT